MLKIGLQLLVLPSKGWRFVDVMLSLVPVTDWVGQPGQHTSSGKVEKTSFLKRLHRNLSDCTNPRETEQQAQGQKCNSSKPQVSEHVTF